MNVDDRGDDGRLRDDLRHALGVIGDAAGPPPVFDELVVTAVPASQHLAVRWLGAVAAVVILIAGLAWVAGREPDREAGPGGASTTHEPVSDTPPPDTDDDTAGVTNPSTPLSTAPQDWSWLDMFGTEPVHPSAPEGWRWQEVGSLRFAVPGSWVVPISPSCAPPGAGIVVVPATVESAAACEPDPGDPPGSVIVRHSPNDDRVGTPVTVGTRSAQALAGPTCGGCPTTYRFDDGLELTVTGPDTDTILDTVTDAGPVRVLQQGPTLNTTGWRTITFDTIAVDVPANWVLIDLPGSYRSGTDADGNLTVSGHLNPGACTPTLFDPTNANTTWLGSSPIVPSCPAALDYSIEPVDAIWIRDAADTDNSIRDVIASGRFNGLDIDVLATFDDHGGSHLDIIATHNNQRVLVTLGVGTDASTTRTVLRSLRANGDG